MTNNKQKFKLGEYVVPDGFDQPKQILGYNPNENTYAISIGDNKYLWFVENILKTIDEATFENIDNIVFSANEPMHNNPSEITLDGISI